MADASVWSDRARRIGLFRYALIRSAADPALSARQRGRLVRAVAAAEHTGPDGRPVRVSRPTVDRWVKAWSSGGFAALVPTPPQVSPRTPADVLDLALTIKQEEPDRTAAQVAEVLRDAPMDVKRREQDPFLMGRLVGELDRPPARCSA